MKNIYFNSVFLQLKTSSNQQSSLHICSFDVTIYFLINALLMQHLTLLKMEPYCKVLPKDKLRIV